MRKILLGTTGVVGAALIGMGAAQAQTAPTVRVGGYFEFTGGYIDDTQDRNAVVIPNSGGRTVSRDKVDFRSDAELHIFVTGKAANGLSYGATIEFQIDNMVTNTGSQSGAGTGVDTDEVYGFVSSPTLGTLRFGDEDSAASLMAVSVPGPTQLGISASWDEFVAQAPDGNRYILADINDGNDATKIIYLSPQFFGLDFGVSYAPNGREGEEYRSVAGGLQRDPTDSIRNELSGAIRYRGSFGNIGVTAGFGAMRADAQDNAVNLQDITQYQAGLQVSGFGLTVGGMYSWGKFAGVTRAALLPGRDNSTNYALGASYAIGAFTLGAFYGKAERDNGPIQADRTQTLWGLGAAYTLAPGLELFANYTNVKDRNIALGSGVLAPAGNGPGQRDRDIDVIVVGTRLAF